jgi:hypothetical protein
MCQEFDFFLGFTRGYRFQLPMRKINTEMSLFNILALKSLGGMNFFEPRPG